MLANQPKFKYLLLVVDILVITISLVLAFFWGGKEITEVGEGRILFLVYYFSTAGAALIACLFSFLYNDLYKRNIIITRHRQTILLVKSMLISCAFVLLMAAVFQHDSLASYGRRFIGMYFVLATALLFSYRVLLVTPLMRTAAEKRIASRRLLIVGARAAGQYVASSLCDDSFSNFNLIGFLDDYMEVGKEIPVDGVEPDHLHNLGKLVDLDRIVERHQVDEILIAIDNVGYERLIHIVDSCLATGKVLRIYSDFLKVIAEKMRIELYADIPVIMLSQIAADGIAWKIKRLFDIVSSSLALVLLAPLFFLIALGIKLSSPGPVFYAQDRIGKGGKPFKFYKFRSMHVSSDNSNHKEFVQNFIKGEDEDKKAQCDTEIRVFKMTDDPRIFKLGAFIRKTSLDEFPQLYNVIKGDMSVVGPRPCLQYEWDCYDEWHKNRLNILPGCSGLWQALGRSTVSFQEMVILDLYYVSNMSLWLDIKIILLTFPVIFMGKGAF